MSRRLAVLFAVWSTVGVCVAPALALDRAGGFAPGAPGLGDPYFRLDGNGGYDVRHYALDLAYAPDTNVLTGVARIRATATQALSRFNLDFRGLTVRSVSVRGRPARWRRAGSELTVVPARGIRRHRRFTVVVRYDGVPRTIRDALGTSGFLATEDGAVVAGQPHGAATWFPVNDHPLDTASYTFRITVPEGLEAVANGVLRRHSTRRGTTTWVWDARAPMASYLATATIGDFDLRARRQGGIRYQDAIDPDLFAAAAPRTGSRFAIARRGQAGYKRLARRIAVPAGGGELSFWVLRDTEPAYDFVFVEARKPGSRRWTTLRDANGHTRRDTGASCAFMLELHPFLAHYLTVDGDGCAPAGTTGAWWAASGASDGYEPWRVDLSDYAGGSVEVALSYVADDAVVYPGVFVDDIVTPSGAGSTSFEDDGDRLDGWTARRPPAGSPTIRRNWIAGTARQAPPPLGDTVAASLAREPEIIRFLAGIFGPYPFSAAGAIVDRSDLGFALETQTRPVYSPGFFADRKSGDAVVVHELAHQWTGDLLPLAAWRHIWLNEGFATYAEWLWGEREGGDTAQETFTADASVPAGDPFWKLRIGDPGAGSLFDGAVYERGAMTLHALRLRVGDRDFFRILRRWTRSRAYRNVTTRQFVALAERVSGEDLSALFRAWLFTPAKPAGIRPRR